MTTQLDQYRAKSTDALRFICKDAHEAAQAMRSIGNLEAECKYLDQVNDACTVLGERLRGTARQQRQMGAV